MLWGLRAPVWFGIGLAALALFLWCLVSMIEAETTSRGYLWGLIIFGAITVIAAILALISQASSGGVTRARDALTEGKSRPPEGRRGRGFSGSSVQNLGSGEIPRPSSGRQIR